MPRASTGPEILIRRELHRRGLRFRVSYARLPGRPDIALTGARVAVIGGRRSSPAISRAIVRKDEQLDSLGWVVVHVWEHEAPARAPDAIEQLWRSRHNGRHASSRDPSKDQV